MRISDWSSDVCSSDLPMPAPISAALRVRLGSSGALVWPVYVAQLLSSRLPASAVAIAAVVDARMETPRRSVRTWMGRPKLNTPPSPRGDGCDESGAGDQAPLTRSEERRVGEEGVSTGRSRWPQ